MGTPPPQAVHQVPGAREVFGRGQSGRKEGFGAVRWMQKGLLLLLPGQAAQLPGNEWPLLAVPRDLLVPLLPAPFPPLLTTSLRVSGRRQKQHGTHLPKQEQSLLRQLLPQLVQQGLATHVLYLVALPVVPLQLSLRSLQRGHVVGLKQQPQEVPQLLIPAAPQRDRQRDVQGSGEGGIEGSSEGGMQCAGVE